VTCLVPGCTNEARNRIGIRLRKPSTRAVWAPNTDAFLCKQHAEAGVRLTLDVAPTNTGEVDATITTSGTVVAERVTPIKRSAA
jgi:hypothetical protein